MELLLGAGTNRQKKMLTVGGEEWRELVTLDRVREYNPDVLFDLREWAKLPFPDDLFDEIHAYEVLEHLGQQGDWGTLARQFEDYWRILKPNGLFCATVPCWKSVWAWGDPDHRRVINEGTLVFLNQMSYGGKDKGGAGMTPMDEYRAVYTADFEAVKIWHTAHPLRENHDQCSFCFVLEAIKPARSR